MADKDCSCDKKKDCGCNNKIKDPENDIIKDPENGLWLNHEDLPIHTLNDIFGNPFLTNLKNYLSDNNMSSKAKIVRNTYTKTIYPLYLFEGNLYEANINNVPFKIDRTIPFNFAIRKISISYIKNNQQIQLSKIVQDTVLKIVCLRIRKNISPKILAYLFDTSTSPDYFITLGGILGSGGIGEIVDNVTNVLDPDNYTRGYIKVLTELVINRYKEPDVIGDDAKRRGEKNDPCPGQVCYRLTHCGQHTVNNSFCCVGFSPNCNC